MLPQGIEFHFQWPGALELLTRATLVLAVAWAAHLALRRANPRWRVALWRGAIAALFLLPAVTAIVPSYTIRLPEKAGKVTEIFLPPTGDALSISGSPSAPGPAVSRSAPLSRSPFPWLVVFWAAGALLSLSSLFAARLRLGRRLADSAPAAETEQKLLLDVARGIGYCGVLPDLRFSRSVEGPFACGLLRPVIVLHSRMLEPEYYSDLSAVLAHETAHLKSADLAWNLAAQAVRALFWFHPLAIALPGAHRAACEDICNATAAAWVGDIQTYSKTLAGVALAMVKPLIAEGGIPMATRATVLKRLEFLKRGIGARPLPKTALGAFILAAAAALAGFSALSLATGRALPEISAAPGVDRADSLASGTDLPDLPPKSAIPPEALEKLKANPSETVVMYYTTDEGRPSAKTTRIVKSSGYPFLDSLAVARAERQLELNKSRGFFKSGMVNFTLVQPWSPEIWEPKPAPGPGAAPRELSQEEIRQRYKPFENPKLKTEPPRPAMPAELAEKDVFTATTVNVYITYDGTVDPDLTFLSRSSGYPELDSLALGWARKLVYEPMQSGATKGKGSYPVTFEWKSPRVRRETARSSHPEEYLDSVEVMPIPSFTPQRAAMPEEIKSELKKSVINRGKKGSTRTRLEPDGTYIRETTTVETTSERWLVGRLLCFVEEDGTVNRGLTVIDSSCGYPVLDSLQLDWAKRTRYIPAQFQGKPVKVKLRRPFHWNLGNSSPAGEK